MRAPIQVKLLLSRVGLNRPAVVRALARYGPARLRELTGEAMAGRGLRAGALRILLRWLEQGSLTVQTGRAGGLRFHLRYLPLSHAQLGAIAFGDLEGGVQEAMVRHLGPGAVLYDIGANLGFFSVLGARLIGPDGGHVYAFEPAPDNAAAIRCNAQLNGVSNVSVVAKAVSSRSGSGRLQIVDDQSWSKLDRYGEHPDTTSVIEVEMVAIDDFLHDGHISPPTLVKIDVEGAELEVLQGMRKTIEEHLPAIVCELHGTHQEFAAAMGEHGYRTINLEGPAPIEEDAGSDYVLALPASHAGD